MAPQRKTANNDDHVTNGTESKKDRILSSTGAGVSKSKKNAGGSTLKDVTNASAVGSSDTATNGQTSEPGDSIKFTELPRRFLHGYRNSHHLPIPSSFKTVHNQAVLSDPTSIGLQSPTMSRAREKRRVSKDTLARAVRRDFMDQSVNELEVEAHACYIVRSGDRAFRMRFVPHTKK